MAFNVVYESFFGPLYLSSSISNDIVCFSISRTLETLVVFEEASKART